MVSQETYDVLWHDYCLFRAQIFSITSISLLICAKKFQVTSSSWCHVTFNQCSFHQMKLNISMTSLLTFGTCLMMLYLLVHFLDFLWMTSILFDVNMYCRFFFYIQIKKLGSSLSLWWIRVWRIEIFFSRSSRGCRLDFTFSFVKKWNT